MMFLNNPFGVRIFPRQKAVTPIRKEINPQPFVLVLRPLRDTPDPLVAANTTCGKSRRCTTECTENTEIRFFNYSFPNSVNSVSSVVNISSSYTLRLGGGHSGFLGCG
jgi:hypothetical protein